MVRSLFRNRRESPAAYAASQPLFDALREACDKIVQQKVNLTLARDIVQQIHVKLTDTNDLDAEDNHRRYVDGIITAWRAASSTYAEIFNQLAAVTAADETEGRLRRKGHGTFKALAKTATLSHERSMEYRTLDDLRNPDLPKEEEAEEDDSEQDTGDALVNVNGKRVAPETESPAVRPTKAIRLSEAIRRDATGKKILWEVGAEKPNVPYGTLSSSDKKAWQAEKRRQKREKRKVLKRDQASKSTPKRQVAAPVPVVQYEDVTAEVDARLKAKAEKKKAKREAKKRTRYSGDSLPNLDSSDTRGEKRSKIAEDSSMNASAVDSQANDPLAKRRSTGDAGSQQHETEPKAKKRKKDHV